MPAKPTDTNDFKHHLKEIAEILAWFEAQDELDVEQALEKVKQAAVLIKASKQRLGELENQFKEIKAETEKE
jgi:exonuclease VII small subunit